MFKELFSRLFSEAPNLMYDYQKKKVSAEVPHNVLCKITKKPPQTNKKQQKNPKQNQNKTPTFLQMQFL